MKTGFSPVTRVLLWSFAPLTVGAFWLSGAFSANAEAKPGQPAATAASDDEAAEDLEGFKAEPHPLDRYQQLLDKSPFDFPIAAAAPPPAIKPMEGWALAGVSDSDDYKSVTMVNLKTNERIRLTHYALPEDPGDNEKIVGADKLTLVTINYEDGKPASLRTATAVVTKNGEQDEVKYDPKIAQMKPPAAAVPLGRPGGAPGQPGAPGGTPNIPLPNQNRGGAPGQPNLPGQGGPQAQNQNNQQLMNLLAGNNSGGGQQPAQPGTAQPNPAGGPPQLNVNVQPNVPPPAPTVNPQPVGATNAPGAQPTQPMRRRVVLPTPDANAPAPANQ